MELYCVKYGEDSMRFGFIKPYNAVRDGETYSLTYLTPSMLDGIKHEHFLKGNIVRHKLTFDGMTENDFKKSRVFDDFDCENPFVKKEKWKTNTHKRRSLKNPTIILAFDNKEDAEQMFTETIYVGQSEYIIYQKDMFILSDDEFDSIPGVETFQTDENDLDGFYCGNNRLKNNERMYIKVDRKEWK